MDKTLPKHVNDRRRRNLFRYTIIAYMSKRMQDQQKEIKSTNSILKTTYVELESQNDKIIDSLHYAEMIQRSLLPGIERIKAVSSDNMFIR